MKKIIARASGQHGTGVFALAPIACGELIVTFSGPVLHRSLVNPNDYHLQIDEEYYLGASGAEDDFVNHSCAPNSGFCDGLDLVALRDIAAGEEITWDYSTAIDEADFAGFDCACGAPTCRRSVRSFRHLDRAVQARLQPQLLPYLRVKYFSA